MKRILLFLLLIPALLQAQTDEKYMAGAVPEIDGKVVITRNVDLNGYTQDMIFTALSEWSKTRFVGERNIVLLTDKEEGVIAAQAEENFRVKIGLFANTAQMQYLLTLKCFDNSFVYEASRIRYCNNPFSEQASETVRAEEYIIDKYALNKDKTKIFKGPGDYRKSTIDIIDNTVAEAQKAVISYYAELADNTQPIQQAAPAQVTQQPAKQAVQVQQPAQPVQAAQTVQQPVAKDTEPVKPVVPSNTEMKNITPAEIPAELISAISNRGLYITAVDGRPLSNAIAGKGALDINSGKAAAMFSVTENTDNILYLLEKADTYTLVYMEENESLLKIECKKGQQFDKLFVGEIIDVKINK